MKQSRRGAIQATSLKRSFASSRSSADSIHSGWAPGESVKMSKVGFIFASAEFWAFVAHRESQFTAAPLRTASLVASAIELPIARLRKSELPRGCCAMYGRLGQIPGHYYRQNRSDNNE
jgi:hypothetical protein